MRDLLKARLARRADLRDLILDRLWESDADSPALNQIRNRLGGE
jgi:hypothetical protein